MSKDDWKTADASKIYSPSAGEASTLSQSAAESGNEADVRRGATVISAAMESRHKTIVIESE